MLLRLYLSYLRAWGDDALSHFGEMSVETAVNLCIFRFGLVVA